MSACSDAVLPRGRPTKASLAARHEALLETASALFVQHGYANVTLMMVARAARVSIRTIYVKFGGISGLLDAVIDAERRRHRDELRALALEGPDGGMPDLRARLELLAQHLARRYARADLRRLQSVVAAETDPRVAAALYAAGPGQLMNVLRATLAQADRAGLLRRELTLEQLCGHFFSCICGGPFALWAPAAMAALPAESGLALFLAAVLRS